MESPTPRSSAGTPACTVVPGILVGLTKLCKLTKVCAAPTLDDETKSQLGASGGYDQRLLVIRLFEAMRSLKSAYIKLQIAHFPYDPAMIAFADEIITSELDSVRALQCLCSSSSGIGSLVNERWFFVQELEAETRKRDSEIVLLKRELEALQRENARLNKQVRSEKPSSSVVKHPDKGFSLPMATPRALVEMPSGMPCALPKRVHHTILRSRSLMMRWNLLYSNRAASRFSAPPSSAPSSSAGEYLCSISPPQAPAYHDQRRTLL